MASSPLYLLDTNILLALVRGKELGQYVAQTYRFAEILRRPIVSIVNHGELLALAERRGWGEKKRVSLQSILDSLVTVDLNNPSILDGYIAVDQANLRNGGRSRTLSHNDMWIAATSRAANAVLLTTDKDFLHLHPDVCSVEYVDPGSRLSTPPGIGGQQKLLN